MKAHRLLQDSTLGSIVIKKKKMKFETSWGQKSVDRATACCPSASTMSPVSSRGIGGSGHGYKSLLKPARKSA